MRHPSRRLLPAAIALLVALGPAALAANDPLIGDGANQQWHLSRVRAPQAWSTTRGSGAIVAVIDTGVRLTHQDLKDRILRNGSGQVIGWDWVDDDNDPSDEQGHGTLVAGLVAATEGNGLGGAGVGPLIRIMPIRVLDEDGAGSGSDVEAAIRWAADNGADVINLSLECAAGGGAPVLNPLACAALGGAPEAAVAYAASKGAVVVAAAGNDGSSFTDYSDDSPVLLVGATDRDDRIASFSDRGRDDVVMAPGGGDDPNEGIVSTWCKVNDGPNEPCNHDDKYGKASGTSFSAPQVSAAVAMLMSQGLSGPEAVARVRATARDLGSPGPDDTYGFGLLDVAAAVAAPPPRPSPNPPPPPPPSPTTPEPEPTANPRPTTPTADPTTATPTTEPPSPTPSPSPSPQPTPPSPSPTDRGPGIVVGALDGDDEDAGAAAAVGLGLLVLTIAAHVAAARGGYGQT
ncbi:MAG: S8 family serine peptidase [Nitriliruptorales bacterium]|nr:S8 family serine peptidase [Nitriliruptorales bacterium]